MKKFILMSLAFASLNAWSDVADEYEKYVNAVPDYSREIAKKDAYVRELAMFVDRLSVAQSHLAKASNATSLLAYYAGKLNEYSEDRCPRHDDNTVDLRETIKQIQATSLMINYLHETYFHLGRYKALESGLEGVCTDANQFKYYSVAALELNIYIPDGIDGMAGVNFVFGDSSEGFPLLKVLPLAGGFYQAMTNVTQNRRLIELRNKLFFYLVKTEEYQAFAKQACESLIASVGKEAFSAQRPLLENLETLSKKVDEKLLDGHRVALTSCLDKYEREVEDYFKEQATLIAEKKYRPELEELKVGQLAVKLHTKISLALLELERTDKCNMGEQTAHVLESNLALLRIYVGHQPEEAKFWESRKQRLIAWRQTCDVKEAP